MYKYINRVYPNDTTQLPHQIPAFQNLPFSRAVCHLLVLLYPVASFRRSQSNVVKLTTLANQIINLYIRADPLPGQYVALLIRDNDRNCRAGHSSACPVPDDVTSG